MSKEGKKKAYLRIDILDFFKSKILICNERRIIMSYRTNSNGDFYSEEDYKEAIRKGDLKENSKGAYDPYTGVQYDDQGRKW